ncbi:ABC transporter ATP-binding protein [Halobacterium salinarum]|uniref:ABC-type transport system ATP-binding/permease protein n=2 Tax=Halobacterium salinarum TaxID=2242 RepID=A0A4D6GQM7_HALS9|nr:ABC-type transport system ATP-binding/permease protein [Halobacterium salinarum]TYO71777.1 ATP-binding cassette, subfamily B, MsbA [Halobacterium salinarum DSM 3754]
MSDQLSFREKMDAIKRVALYRPLFTVGIIVLSVFAAILEGIGVSYLLPIIQQARGEGDPGTLVQGFMQVYDFFGVPFVLEYIIVGVALVMTLRYTSTFLVAWLRAKLRVHYVRDIQTRAYDSALNARIGYFDQQGSDEILNAIVTQSREAGYAIMRLVRIVEQSILSLMYLAVAMYLSPWLTLTAGTILGALTFLIRNRIESGYAVGDRVAEANERVQEVVQAGTQGIRDVKLFGLSGEFFERFDDYVGTFVRSKVTLRRNQAAIQNLYQLTTAITVFVLIYFALEFSSLSLGGLGVFLFAMFRLSPRISNLNTWIYRLEGDLPHLVRTEQLIDEMRTNQEPTDSNTPVPSQIERIEADSLDFSYDGDEQVLDDVTYSVERGEFIAFVGPSGAGKSTIVSLLARMYEPDSGEIRADGTPIQEFDLAEWREHLSMVRQNPYIFNDTLEYNVRVGNRDASQSKIERACELACVTEFLDELPEGYQTTLGDDGVRLSGGQKQRVALARALVRDVDFLLLDEATSDLDTNIEEDVHDGIESLDAEHGLVVVAHRLSTVRNADRIYTMVNGRVEEVGSHEELLKAEETYAELYSADE